MLFQVSVSRSACGEPNCCERYGYVIVDSQDENGALAHARSYVEVERAWSAEPLTIGRPVWE